MSHKKAFIIGGIFLLIAIIGLTANYYLNSLSSAKTASHQTVALSPTTNQIKNLIATSATSSGSTLTINNQVYTLEVSRTLAEQEQGLSDTTSLPTNTLMLFDFDHSDFWGIWMKDMNYSLDVFWLDTHYSVITIQPNMAPSSYPIIYQPARAAKYVIEAPAGFAAQEKILVGSVLDIKE